MKKATPVILALAVVLALAGDARAQLFGRRNQTNVKVVVKNQPAAVQAVQVQKVQVQKIQKVQVVQQVQQVQHVQRVVVQPVQAVVQQYGYAQAVQVQPVQAYYRVQAVQTYAAPLAFSSGYDCGQTQQLRAEIEQLRLQQQRLQLQQQLQAPPMAPAR